MIAIPYAGVVFADLELGERLKVTLGSLVYDLVVLDGPAYKMLLEWHHNQPLEVAQLRAFRRVGGRRRAMVCGERLEIVTENRSIEGEMVALQRNGVKIF